MILKKKLNHVEQFLIAAADLRKYTPLYCEEHGVFFKRKDVNDKKCPYCKKKCKVIDNIKELKESL